MAEQVRAALGAAVGAAVGAALEALPLCMQVLTTASSSPQVRAAVGAALEALPPAIELAPLAAPTSDETSMEASRNSPEAERARLAARVMLGERSALEACAAVWERAAMAIDSKGAS